MLEALQCNEHYHHIYLQLNISIQPEIQPTKLPLARITYFFSLRTDGKNHQPWQQIEVFKISRTIKIEPRREENPVGG